MRMSINRDDPGYHKEARRYFQPFLNGKKVTHCYIADEDMGFVMRHKTDGNGQIILDHAKGETVKEKLFGNVEIRRVR